MTDLLRSVGVAAWILALIVAVVGFGGELVADKILRRTPKPWAQRLATFAIMFFVGLYAAKILEISIALTDAGHAIRDLRLEMESRLQRIEQLDHYLAAMRVVGGLKLESTFRQLLMGEIDSVNEKLRQLKGQEIVLRREEVIPKWEKLILNSKRQVEATNVVSLDDWNKFSPTAGEDVHRRALANHVEIRRIFIYSGSDPQAKKQLIEVGNRQSKWGVRVKLLSSTWIAESPFVSEFLRDVGTQDIVIFDEECVLLTSVDGNSQIVRSILTASPHSLQKAENFYEKLWAEAEDLPKKAP